MKSISKAALSSRISRVKVSGDLKAVLLRLISSTGLLPA